MREIVLKFHSWLTLSRPAFHTVGVLPFFLGTILAFRLDGVFNLEIFLWGTFAVILIMLATYHMGEYFDREGDAISCQLHANRFAGGTRVIPKGKASLSVPLWTGISSIALAFLIGIVLQFFYCTGPWTLVLGAIGGFAGFFYSTEPIRLVKRGLGEITIAFCYGWLPVATAFYLQTGRIDSLIHWVWLPIGSSIFNVILLNEFPDYEADMATGKKNLLYRLGREKGSWLFNIANAFTVLTLYLSPIFGVPMKVWMFFFPFALLAGYITSAMIKGDYRNPQKLEILCGLNIAVNLGTSASYILAFF
jgi:1,4-dihydroxy-2-naphthoate octaprenyltransferase